MQKVKISYIKSISDETGKYGAQKKIVFVEELEGGDRTISGWVAIKQFNEEDWKNGKTLELDISQNGKYTNFKMPTKTSKSDEKIEKIYEGMRVIYKMLQNIEKRLDAKDGAEFIKPEISSEERSLRDF